MAKHRRCIGVQNAFPSMHTEVDELKFCMQVYTYLRRVRTQEVATGMCAWVRVFNL